MRRALVALLFVTAASTAASSIALGKGPDPKLKETALAALSGKCTAETMDDVIAGKGKDAWLATSCHDKDGNYTVYLLHQPAGGAAVVAAEEPADADQAMVLKIAPQKKKMCVEYARAVGEKHTKGFFLCADQ
jgi:hypothetical protein